MSIPDKIPITFEWRGKWYNGELGSVTGGSSSPATTWHLMINSYFFGALAYTETRGWQFHSPTGYFEDLADFFADYMVAYIQ